MSSSMWEKACSPTLTEDWSCAAKSAESSTSERVERDGAGCEREAVVVVVVGACMKDEG